MCKDEKPINTDIQTPVNRESKAFLLHVPPSSVVPSLESYLLKIKCHDLRYTENTGPMIHNVFHKYFMNPFAILKPVGQEKKKKTLSPILVPALPAHHWGVGVTCHFCLTVCAWDRLGAWKMGSRTERGTEKK